MAVRAFATSRVSAASSSSSPAKARASSAKRAAKKVLQKATKSALGRECKRKMVLREFQSLKSLIPSVSAASKAVSPLEVVLEAIEDIFRQRAAKAGATGYKRLGQGDGDEVA